MLANDQLQAVAAKHGFSTGAVEQMVHALRSGNGTMAQFSHPEFGGSGQWMRGGMIMIGDMFNNGLKARVDALCYDLLSIPATTTAPAPAESGFGSWHQPSSWWPQDLGSPSSSGGQNHFRYAYFPGSNRLAIEDHGNLHVFDTSGHSIGGFSQQQQNGLQGFCFSSQWGTFSVTSLPSVFVQR